MAIRQGLPTTGNEKPDPERGEPPPPPGPPGGTPVVSPEAVGALIASIARRLDEAGEAAWARALEDATAPGRGDHAARNDRIRRVLEEVSEQCRGKLSADVCADVARCLREIEGVPA